MTKKKIEKLVYAVLCLITGILACIFPSFTSQYFSLFLGIFLLMKGIITLFIEKQQAPQFTPVFPIIHIVSGVIIILGWRFIIQGIFTIIGLGLLMFGLGKIRLIPFYKAVERKPVIPIVECIFYSLIGIIFIVSSFTVSFEGALGYIIGGGLILLAIDLFIKCLSKDHEYIDFQTTFGHFRDDLKNNSPVIDEDETSTPLSKDVIEGEVTNETIIDDNVDDNNN